MNSLLSHIKSSDPAQRRSAGRILKFLALLLAFTIIARGTGGATLARVVLASPDRSEIIDSVSGTATVTSTDTIEITVPEFLTIAEMLVGVGQYIKAGDAIAVFEMEDLEERRIREGANLSRLSLDLEQLEREENVDASPLETAQRALNRAREDYNTTVRQGQTNIADARAELELLLEAAYEDSYILPSAIRSHRRALEDYLNTLEQGQAEISAAEDALLEINVDDTALNNAIRSHQRALEDYESTVAQGEAAVAAAEEALAELRGRRPSDHDRTAIELAQRNYQRARDDYNALKQQAGDNERSAQQALDWAIEFYNQLLLSPNQDPAAIAAAWAAVEQAQNALNAARNNADPGLLAASRRVEDEAARLAQAQREFANATQNALEQAENALEAAKTQANNSHLAVTRSLEDAERQLELAQQNFENSKQSEIERLENALTTAQIRAENDLLAATRWLEDASNTVNTAVEQAQTALQNTITQAGDNRRAAARQIENAAASLDTAKQTHERNLQQTADTKTQNIINASTLRLDVAAQQYAVDMLDKLITNRGVLYAARAGAVSMALPAGYVTNSEPVVTLRDTNGGFEAKMYIPQSAAERLTIGSEAEVTTGGGSMFFTPTTTGTVTAVSLPDENDYVTVTIGLPPYGNWSVGQRIDAQVILNRANYDLSVPITAVHSDNTGYFLLVMEQRSTVLGLQNVVVRVNVTVVAADDMTVSVLGAVGRNSQVIIGSNRTVSVGDRVRVSE